MLTKSKILKVFIDGKHVRNISAKNEMYIVTLKKGQIVDYWVHGEGRFYDLLVEQGGIYHIYVSSEGNPFVVRNG